MRGWNRKQKNQTKENFEQRNRIYFQIKIYKPRYIYRYKYSLSDQNQLSIIKHIAIRSAYSSILIWLND